MLHSSNALHSLQKKKKRKKKAKQNTPDPKQENTCKLKKKKKSCIKQSLQQKFSKPAGGALRGTAWWRDTQIDGEKLTRKFLGESGVKIHSIKVKSCSTLGSCIVFACCQPPYFFILESRIKNRIAHQTELQPKPSPLPKNKLLDNWLRPQSEIQ